MAGGASLSRGGGTRQRALESTGASEKEWRTRFFSPLSRVLSLDVAFHSSLASFLLKKSKRKKNRNFPTMARHRPPGDSSSDDDHGGPHQPPAKRVKRFRHKSAAQAAKEVKLWKAHVAASTSPASPLRMWLRPPASARLSSSHPLISRRCPVCGRYFLVTTDREANVIWLAARGEMCQAAAARSPL